MPDPFLGEIRIFAGNFAPIDWILCQGQLLSIKDNYALFSLIGTIYGGDGVNTFAAPDLRGRFAVHAGQGPGRGNRSLGQTAGEENVSLAVEHCPAHMHSASASDTGNTSTPTGHFWSTDPNGNTAAFNDTANALMAGTAIAPAGDSAPHPNIQPFLAISYIMATTGIMPRADAQAGIC